MAEHTYDTWMEAQGIPVHRGYYIEVAPWSLRECNAAFIQLAGMQGVVESRIQDIPPGGTLPPFKSAFDELCYVLAGQGSTTVWSTKSDKRHSFEWAPRSMFLLPRNTWHQLSNMQGDHNVRLLHYNYSPMAMSAASNPDFFFNNPYDEELPTSDDFFSEAQAITQEHIGEGEAGRTQWHGNFFPDMGVWDKLMHRPGRGSLNRSVYMKVPGTELTAHMSVFEAGTYKKGHRHGPGRVIVIPGGEGYSIMWANEDSEKIVIPWHEASCFVPPDRWFHQHFNAGAIDGRYLALHPAGQFMGQDETVQDRARDQIEYTQEDPWIREKFESELAARGIKTVMPAEAYTNPNYVWDYKGVANT
ncbi:MAG: cupin domain-containing protein [Chloroflexi bacterium]|nr:cupin domain-containing protein [Chloroflexota bacterium]